MVETDCWSAGKSIPDNLEEVGLEWLTLSAGVVWLDWDRFIVRDDGKQLCSDKSGRPGCCHSFESSVSEQMVACDNVEMFDFVRVISGILVGIAECIGNVCDLE